METIEESGETPVDARAEAARADRDDLLFLGREFLTWIAFHAETEGGVFGGVLQGGPPPFTLLLGGKLLLRTFAGMVTDVALRGPAPSSSPDMRYVIAGGLAVKEADLRLDQGERSWTFALAAEHLDLKRVKLPTLLAEDEESRTDERVALLGELNESIRFAWGVFMALRASPSAWAATVASLREWLEEHDEKAAA